MIEDGWYWYRAENGDLEVIEVVDGRIYQTGSDVVTRMHDWPDRGEFHVLDGEIVGRIEPPRIGP